MAKRREAALKRLREKAKQEKQEAKRARREARDAEKTTEDSVDQQALMDEFARLSELHESNQITTDRYNAERKRIFGALGIEIDD